MYFNSRTITIVSLLLLLVFGSCKSLPFGQKGRSPSTAIELDTMVLDFTVGPPATYHIPPQIFFDIHHVELDIRFNWELEEVYGKAKLDISAYAEPIDHILLDARGFEIQHLAVHYPDTILTPAYTYDNREIQIELSRTISTTDTIAIEVKYIARPSKLDIQTGSAITSNQGLYFINPRGEIEGKPSQIWTQGEPECNSSWFPSTDHPHEKFTQEIFLTVDSKFHTISNGKLIYSDINDDGTRTDYWKQAKPHSNYLTMIAVGEFALVKDSWKDLDVWYYLDDEYRNDAKAIFGNTPEMLEFYSSLLNFPYPWEKYHQVVVKDFVSGAMENTSAVIHGDFVQLTERELLDQSHEDVIAHELFHHWFGDLVTCESWSQLTLNEGFATYGEYLWKEYKYGVEEARLHLQRDLDAYLSEASYKTNPMIRDRYHSPDDLFDSHTYQKGGRLLHTLRLELGDSIFFTSLSHYLNKHQFQSVDLADLRKSVEEISGRSFRWFFDQWFTKEGHPIIETSYAVQGNALQVVIQQVQSEDWPTYMMHVPYTIGYASGKTEQSSLWLDGRSDTFNIEVSEKVEWCSVDPTRDMPWEITESKPLDHWKAQLVGGSSFITRESALNAIINQDPQFAIAQGEHLLNDPFWLMRSYGLNLISKSKTYNESIKALLIESTQLDNKSSVRAAAYAALDSLAGASGEFNILYAYGLRDSSYYVVQTCLSILLARDACFASEQVKPLESEKKGGIPTWVARVYANCPNESQFSFFEESISEASGFNLFLIGSDFTSYISQLAQENLTDNFVNVMEAVNQSSEDWWASATSLNGLETAQSYYNTRIETLEATPNLEMEQIQHLAQLRTKKAQLSQLVAEIRSTHDQKASPFSP